MVLFLVLVNKCACPIISHGLIQLIGVNDAEGAGSMMKCLKLSIEVDGFLDCCWYCCYLFYIY